MICSIIREVLLEIKKTILSKNFFDHKTSRIKGYTEKRLIPIFTKEPPNTSYSKEYFGIIFIHLSWSDIQKIRDNIFLVRMYLSYFWRFWLPGSHLAIKNKNIVLIDWNKKNLIPNFCRLATIYQKNLIPNFWMASLDFKDIWRKFGIIYFSV